MTFFEFSSPLSAYPVVPDIDTAALSVYNIAVIILAGKEYDMKEIVYVHEPTDLQCGQAVLAMVLGMPVEDVADELDNHRETTLREMKDFFRSHGVSISDERIQVTDKSQLPELCLLSLETPRCWHWSLYCSGTFYDPEHGVMDDFPQSARKYYWKLSFEQ